MDDRPPGCVDEHRVGFHRGQFAGPDQVLRPFGQDKVDRRDITGGQQGGKAVHPFHPDLGASFVGEVRAPRDKAHAEGARKIGHRRPKTPKADQSKRQTLQIAPGLCLPAPACHGIDVGDQVARRRKDQGHGQMRCRGGPAGGAADRNAPRTGRRHVDGTVAHAGRDDQAQVGQRIYQSAGQGRAFAHHAQHLEGGKRFGKAFGGDGIAEHRDAIAQGAPVGVAIRIAKVVVQHGDLHRLSFS